MPARSSAVTSCSGCCNGGAEVTDADGERRMSRRVARKACYGRCFRWIWQVPKLIGY